MEIGKIYRAQYNVYDIYDINTYLFEIVSGPMESIMGFREYYVARFLETNSLIHLYPQDWSYLQMLSSLEQELL